LCAILFGTTISNSTQPNDMYELLVRLFYLLDAIKGILIGLAVIAVCLSQVIFGWIGDAWWIRLAYGLAALFLGVPVLLVGLAHLYVAITGDVGTRRPAREFFRK